MIAGGGGDGAPLFSRPKPQSKGKTPGGARVVRRQKLEARDRSAASGAAANHHQARGTETVEPAARRAKPTRRRRQRELDRDDRRRTGGGGGGAKVPAGRPRGPWPGRGRADAGSGDASREEVSGTVIGSPEGRKGELAFGAPGLKQRRRRGRRRRLGAAIAIGVAALLAAGARRRRQQRRGRLA